MHKPLNQFLLVVCCLIITHVNAQEAPEAKTLFGKGNGINIKKIGFNVAPALGYTRFDGSDAALFHLRGGVTLNDRLTIGGYYAVSMNNVVPRSETIPNIYMDYWSFGGLIEPTLFAKKLFHVTLPITLGYGEVEMDNEPDDLNLGESNFFQAEAALMLEANLIKNLRLNIGAGYRQLGAMTYRNMTESDISGPTLYIGLRAGLFR